MRKGTGKKVVRATAPPIAKEGDSDEVVATSIRINKGIHDRLRKLAFDKRTPMITYIERGAEMILKKENY